MTQEELYWYSKRLYLKADAKEREIREEAKRVFMREQQWNAKWWTPKDVERCRMNIETQAQKYIEFARLEILEPVLDSQQKIRLETLRFEKKMKEEERKRQEEKMERERKEREEERRKKEEEEKRLAPIRAKEAEERAKKEKQEKEKREREEQERRAQLEARAKQLQKEENTRTALGWLAGIIIVGGIIAVIIIFRKWILAALLIIGLIGVIAEYT